jgi:hypothetical protein
MPEQALRAEHEDQDQDREDDRLRPVRTGRMPRETLVEVLDEADHESAERCAGEVADAAEHGGGEGEEPDLEAEIEACGREVHDVQEAADACERAPERERERDRAIDVDAEHARGVAILRRGAHGLAGARLLHEEGHREQRRDRDQQHDQRLLAVGRLADVEERRGGKDVVRLAVVEAEEDGAEVLQDEADPDRRDQGSEPRRIA